MRWHLIVDATGFSGAVNMAIDQSLLHAARAGDGYLRIYRWNPPCLSFGRNEPARRRYDAELIGALGLDTVRRPTGGRAVWHEREVTYAVAAPEETFGSLRTTYRHIHATLSRALERLGVPARQADQGPVAALGAGSCFSAPVGGEIMVGSRKLVGSAQVREGGAFLQHGSILLDEGQDLVARISKDPHGPVHATSLSAILGRRVSFQETSEAIASCVTEAWDGEWLPPRASTAPSTCFAFDDSAWTWRR